MKSYRKHHVKNKLKQIRPKKKLYKNRLFWVFVSVIILVFMSAYFFLFSEEFQVDNIKISGNKKVQSEKIREVVSSEVDKRIINFGKWGFFSKSIFLVDPKKMDSRIMEKLPAVQSASVRKEYPRTINLVITERQPIGIYCGQSGCFYIDENGVAIEPAFPAPGNFPVIKGKEAITKSIVQSILKIEKNLRDRFQIDIKEVFVTSPLLLNIKTMENWEAYFDLSYDTDLQIAKLDSLLKNEIPEASRPKIQYIDLRFKDKAYYK